jgi:asparagine synthase (glutamine-hydrolysing)
MCGIVGFLDIGLWVTRVKAPRILKGMADAIAARGPDDFSFWSDDECGIGLAHRRLSVLDLSVAGRQPMSSLNGQYFIVFNGEIYNHLDLRKELEKIDSSVRWRGNSDTETLLAGFCIWGIEDTLKRCTGMFALAVWDRAIRALTLARDRMGEKPLYYGWQGQENEATFIFGSELSAIKVHPAFNAVISRDSLSLMMRHSYIPAPHSIYKGIYKLPPGCLLTVSLGQRIPVVISYWSLIEKAESGVAAPFHGSDNDAINALELLLKDVVREQMVADVPLGAFLSGGIDSSTIVALMQAQSSRPVKTFTIGFNEREYNEAVYAAAVAKHLGTDHTELYVTPRQALDVIPNLPKIYSEPFSDSSQIPTFLVSQLARQQVTVALSGDAGDELFAGYNRYLLSRNLWGKVSAMPHWLRNIGAAGIRSVSPGAWDSLLYPVNKLLPESYRNVCSGDRLYKAARALSSSSIADFYLGMVTHWEPETVVLGATEPLTHLRGQPLSLKGLDSIQRMMALDSITYLPDDILVKTDRASMSASLEGRVPFLDHRLVEFAWQLPQHMKLRDGVGKWILRQVLYRHVPREMIERPKMGFGVPIDRWLRGVLRDWAESLLAEHRLESEGFFNPIPIRKMWAEHLSGRRNWQYHLWDVLMFQAWLEAQKT